MQAEQRENRPRVVVVGGGYGGMTVLLELARTRRFELCLLDTQDAFLDGVHLHKTVYLPLDRYRHDFGRLAAKHGFCFQQCRVPVDGPSLQRWQQDNAVTVGEQHFPFDYLVVCTGSRPILPQGVQADDCLTLEQLRERGAGPVLNRFLAAHPPAERHLSIIGGGASGVQFLFELDDHWRAMGERCQINFVHADPVPLSGFPPAFADHVVAKLRSRPGTIHHYPGCRFKSHQDGELVVVRGKERLNLPSQLGLLLLGLEAAPLSIKTTASGQVVTEGEILPRVFAAGDCSDYAAVGMNTPSAQAAVRKGKAVAANIEQHLDQRPLQPYEYQELGYFVSLGPGDGIGWMLANNAVVSGIPAFAVKNTVEAQFRLFLEGVDTFLPFDPRRFNPLRRWRGS